MSGVLFNRKCCATCAFWSGPREADSFGSHARCPHSNEKGVCGNPKSPNKKKSMEAGYGSCSKWEKWPALSKMK